MFERSSEYNYFRSCVPRKKIVVSDINEEIWTIYDAGPRNIMYPILFLPPCSGTCDVFYKQILYLSSIGYRAISVSYPIVWNVEDWCISFIRLLDKLNIFQVHLFGASLGGYLAQKLIEFTEPNAPRVISLILCNSFIDTSIFNLNFRSKLFWMFPRYLLESSLMSGLSISSNDPTIKDGNNFIEKHMKDLSRAELASRLTLNCNIDNVNSTIIHELHITIIDVFDRNALTYNVNSNLIKAYPNAKRAHLKSGGNFPYLSRFNDVNIFIQVHMSKFIDSRFEGRETNAESSTFEFSSL